MKDSTKWKSLFNKIEWRISTCVCPTPCFVDVLFFKLLNAAALFRGDSWQVDIVGLTQSCVANCNEVVEPRPFCYCWCVTINWLAPLAGYLTFHKIVSSISIDLSMPAWTVASAPFLCFLYFYLSFCLLLGLCLRRYLLVVHPAKYDRQRFNQLQASEKQKHKQDLEQVSTERTYGVFDITICYVHPCTACRYIVTSI